MFIAMNRFQIVPGRSADFEQIWRERESHLRGVPGFVQFALLRGEGEGEYVSHSTWESREAFVEWTQSENFMKGHRQGSLAGILAGPPQVSLHDVIIVETPAGRATGAGG